MLVVHRTTIQAAPLESLRLPFCAIVMQAWVRQSSSQRPRLITHTCLSGGRHMHAQEFLWSVSSRIQTAGLNMICPACQCLVTRTTGLWGIFLQEVAQAPSTT
ncbi:hypothetical protein DPMN_052493 [Dreissena polymorpha]|uniref:Uncharacterized protein n=1 Tax=Dreissena polymorpha TaxID=45954 RepID=A0A9D4HPX6_DREPO|nr:hypothetical protein DPMN_052484 [Dreissena polymorpha]KAH3726625.1 hypothetical protein DPMN_052493 [Dreissena polymorpha]